MCSVLSFGNLSLIAPIANVVIVPVVPYVMFLGTPALLAGLAWLPLGQWLAPALWLPLTWLAEGALLLAAPRWAAVLLPPLPLWLPILYYGAVIAVHVIRWRRGQPTANTPRMRE